jgi:hypothetical protein
VLAAYGHDSSCRCLTRALPSVAPERERFSQRWHRTEDREG